jgi:hypothetical protein
MNTSTNSAVLVVVLIALAVALVAWVTIQRQRSLRLRRRFGPEYDRAVQQFGGRTRAEGELLKREARVARLNIVPLTPADSVRFSQAWSALQGRFIENPTGAVAEADRLVRELMAKRGYPMCDFEHRAADISVNHAGVVATYRAAQTIAARETCADADTEELRKALVHYRTLFAELLGVAPGIAAEIAAPAMPADAGMPVPSGSSAG